MARDRNAPRVNWPWSPIPDLPHALVAAKQAGAVAYLIGLSYLLMALMNAAGVNPFASLIATGLDPTTEIISDVVLGALAFVLGWAIGRKPRLPLVLIACLWGAAEAITKIVVVLQAAGNGNSSFLGGLFLPVIVLLIIGTALRGVFAIGRYEGTEDLRV